MPILTLLKLIPGRDWLYIAIIVALLTGFGVYTLHERSVGRTQIEKVDKAAVTKQVKKNEVLSNVATSDIDKAQDAFDLRVSAPPPPPVASLVCEPAHDSRRVPDRASAPGVSDGPPTPARLLPQESAGSFDPSVPALKAADEADTVSAELELAQATIRAYQKQGVVKDGR